MRYSEWMNDSFPSIICIIVMIAETIINAIKMIKHVIDVKGMIYDLL